MLKKVLSFVRRFFRSPRDPGRSDYVRRPKKLIYDIIPPNLESFSREILGIKKYPSRAQQLFGYSWRAVFYFIIGVNILTGITPADLLKKSVIALMGGQEKSIELYATDCVGSDFSNEVVWKNSDLASGAPNVKLITPEESYNEQNSAVYYGGAGSMLCRGFRPGDQIDKLPLTVGKTAGSAETEPSGATITDYEAEIATTADQAIIDDEYISATDSSTTRAIDSSAPTDGSVVELKSSQVDVSSSSAEQRPGPEAANDAEVIDLKDNPVEPDNLAAPVADPVIGQSENIVDVIKDAFSVGGTDLINLMDGFKLLAKAEEVKTEQAARPGVFVSAKINFSLEEIFNMSASTSEAVATATDLSKIKKEGLIIWYSTDYATGTEEQAESWSELTTLPSGTLLECDEIKSATDCSKQVLGTGSAGGYLSFSAPLINSWDEAEQLKIKIEGRLPGQTESVWYIDSVWLTIDYTPGQAIEIENNEDGYAPEDTISIDHKDIEFKHTDDNQDENILIKTDSKEYQGVTGATVYFSLTNFSASPERINLQIYFPQDKGNVNKIERLVRGVWAEEIATDEPLAETSLLNIALRREIKRKPVPDFLNKKTSTRGAGVLIGAGKSQFYKMEIAYPRSTAGEFYIEAIGDHQGYGLLDPWWNSSWKYKLPISINNSANASTATSTQILVEIASTTADFWNRVNSDGSDIRFLNSSETTELNFWTQYWDKAASSAQIWVQVDSIPGATTSQIFLYYNNAAAASSSNMYATFSYGTMVDLYYVVTNTFATVTVVSLIDNNQIQFNNGTAVNLNRQQIASFTPVTSTSTLRAKGPVQASVTGVQAGTTLVPIAYAGTAFAMPYGTNVATEAWSRYAPFTNATTTIYNSNTADTAILIPANTAATRVYNISNNGTTRLLATNPVLATYYISNTTYSAAVYPATNRDLYGIHSGTNRIGFTGNTNFTIFCSSGATANVTGQTTANPYTNGTCTAANEGAGNAIRLTAQTNPIGSIQYNDSDGTSMSVFLPDIELSTEYMVPRNTAYIAVACLPKQGTTTLSIYDPSNVLVTSATCTPTVTNPGKSYFGVADVATYNAGSRIVSTNNKPFYAYYEDVQALVAAGGDESNFIGAVQARKKQPAEPTVTVGNAVKYNITISGKVYTDEGTTVLTGGPVIGLAIDSQLIATTTASSTAGTFIFSDITAPDSGSSTVIFIASSTISGASFSRYPGVGNLTGYDIYQNRIILRHDDAGPITNADINNYDGDQNSQIKAVVSGGNLAASSSQMLYIWPGKEYRPGGTIILGAGAASSTPGGDLKIASSTSIFNPEANAVSVGGDWFNLGTYSKTAGQTVSFTATSAGFQIDNGTSTFINLIFNGAGGGWNFATSTTLDGNLTMTSGTLTGTSSVTVKGGNVSGDGNINLSAGNFYLNGTGNFGGNTDWQFGALIFGDSLVQATTTKAGGGSITASTTLTISASHYLNASSSVWIIKGTGSPLILNGTLLPQTSTIRYASTGNVQPVMFNYYRLELAPAAVGSPTYTIPGGSLTTADYFSVGDGVNPVTVSALTNNSVLDVNGDLLIGTSSTFIAASSSSFTVAGNWINYGLFNHASGTVTFDATTVGRQIRASSSPFYNVDFNNSTGGWSFITDVVINGNLAVASGTLSGAVNLAVQGGSITGNGLISLSGGTLTLSGSGNFGGLQDWTFSSLVFGSGSTASTTTKIGGGNIIVNSALTVASLQTLDVGAANWTLTGGGTPLVVNGNFIASYSIFRFIANTNTNIAATNFYRLELRPAAAGSPSYTIASGMLVTADYLLIGDGVNPVTVTAYTNNSILDINGNLTIATSSTLTAASSSDLALAGNWSNYGVFNHSNATTTFDAASTGHTINAGNSPFYNLNFNNPAGGWTVINNATSSNNWNLAAAADFTAASGITLEVNGLFTNNLDNASTTWTGATLYLDGTSQTINQKTGAFDHYDVLKIGPNTDARMWNSVADNYQVDPSASLYSMNHGNVSGHLYIWGDYHISPGRTDYWSGVTDYDGTDITASARESYAYMASGTVITLDGGTLNIIGSSTVTSKITNQGSGFWSWRVSSGTLNADYYQVRKTDVAGLDLTGAPTITSLDNGDFELSANGGRLITIAPSVINANPNMIITGNIFSSTVGTSSVYNVSLSGAAANNWNFTAHSGNLAGEDYDNDPGDPRGFIIWDDSPVILVRSQNWQWFHDQDQETPTSSAAAEITAPSGIALGSKLKLRLTIKETNSVPYNNIKVRLQYSTFADFTEDVNFVAEINASSSAAWAYADGVDLDNSAITRQLLSDSSVPATHNESGISTSSFDIAADSANEWEFTVFNNDGLPGNTYYFRAYSDNLPGGVIPVNDGESYPSLVSGTSTMGSSILGVPQGTVVEGITADISTNAMSLPFGPMTLGQPREGVQQFSVSTNGEGGYQLLVYQRQDLMNEHGAIISPIAATNDNPQSWPANPDPSGFGYHTSDENLSGLSPSRFAPDNSYAKLETSMREVGFSSIPVQNETINIVYKLEVTAPTQSPGQYQSELVYIMVPTY